MVKLFTELWDLTFYFLRFSCSCPLIVSLTFQDSFPSISVIGIILHQMKLTQVLLNVFNQNFFGPPPGSRTSHFHPDYLSQQARPSPSLCMSKPSQPVVPQMLKQGLHITPYRHFITGHSDRQGDICHVAQHTATAALQSFLKLIGDTPCFNSIQKKRSYACAINTASVFQQYEPVCEETSKILPLSLRSSSSCLDRSLHTSLTTHHITQVTEAVDLPHHFPVCVYGLLTTVS